LLAKFGTSQEDTLKVAHALRNRDATKGDQFKLYAVLQDWHACATIMKSWPLEAVLGVVAECVNTPPIEGERRSEHAKETA
jgi:hypothetical protein